jgi:hypothetical protein
VWRASKLASAHLEAVMLYAHARGMGGRYIALDSVAGFKHWRQAQAVMVTARQAAPQHPSPPGMAHSMHCQTSSGLSSLTLVSTLVSKFPRASSFLPGSDGPLCGRINLFEQLVDVVGRYVSLTSTGCAGANSDKMRIEDSANLSQKRLSI